MKKAYVSEKNGVVTLSIIRDARPSMQISIDLGFSPLFALDLPFPLDEPTSSNHIFSQGIGILVEQIHLFLNDRGFVETEIVDVINSIYNTLDEYQQEQGEEQPFDIDEGGQLEMHEIPFALSESFISMVQEQIISNKVASEYVNQAVEFEKRLKERQNQNDQNSRAKNEAADIINRYKNTIQKTVPGPLYVTLYDRFGKPSGVTRVTNQGLTKWAGKRGTELAALTKVSFVAHSPGHRNSKGEKAEWVIKSHETGKIISSHKTKAEAKSHLQDMHTHKNSLFNQETFNFGNNEHTNVGKVPSKPFLLLEDTSVPFLEAPKLKVRAKIDYDVDSGPDTRRDVVITLEGDLGPSFKLYVTPLANGDLEGEVDVVTKGEDKGLPPYKPFAEFSENQMHTTQKFLYEVRNILNQEYNEEISKAKANGDRALAQALKTECGLKYQEIMADIVGQLVPTPASKWSKLLNKL